MNIVLGNLPKGVSEKDIREFFLHIAKVLKVTIFNNTETKHSMYECIVDIDISDRVAASILAKRINHTIWKGASISAHLLIFED